MSQITRCPACSTTFKVVADQLRISEGWVRCGQCKEVFDAAANLLTGDTPSLLPDLPLPDPRSAPLATRRARPPERSWGAPQSPESTGADQRRGAVEPVSGPQVPATDPEPAASVPDPVLSIPAPSVPAFLAAAHRPGEPGEALPASADSAPVDLEPDWIARLRATPSPSLKPTPAPFAPQGPDRTGTAGLGEATERGARAGVVVPRADEGFWRASPVELPRPASDPKPEALPPVPSMSAEPDWGLAGEPAWPTPGAPSDPLAVPMASEYSLPGAPVEGGDVPAGEPRDAPFVAAAPLLADDRLGEVSPGAADTTAEAVADGGDPSLFATAPERRTPPAAYASDDDDDEAELDPEVSFVRAARRRAFWRRPMVRLLLSLVVLALLAALGAQVAYQERDRLAAMVPQSRPALNWACSWIGCDVAPARQIADVIIDSSSFNKGRGDSYQLALTLKSRANIPLAMPAVEVTLTDTQDQPVLRRVLLPTDMAAPAELPPRGEWSASVSVIVTTGGARVAGYRLLAFYP